MSSFSRRKQKSCNHQQNGGGCPFQDGGACPLQSGGDSWQWVEGVVGGPGQQSVAEDGAIRMNAMSGGRRRSRRRHSRRRRSCRKSRRHRRRH